MMFGRRGNVMGYMVVIGWLNSRRGNPVNSVWAAQGQLQMFCLRARSRNTDRDVAGAGVSTARLAVVDGFQPVRGLALPTPAEITNLILSYSGPCFFHFLISLISTYFCQMSQAEHANVVTTLSVDKCYTESLLRWITITVTPPTYILYMTAATGSKKKCKSR